LRMICNLWARKSLNSFFLGKFAPFWPFCDQCHDALG
jgi:hypothetical protein